MDVRNVLILAGKEVRDSLRNRWFLLYAGAFTILTLALAYLSIAGLGETGFAGFGKTAAGIINLIMLIVPLMALTIGASSLVSERESGTLISLLAQPVNRLEVIAGKFLGLATALLAALALGFGLSAAVMAAKGGTLQVEAYAWLVSLSFVLALAMLSTGMLISAAARTVSVALGAAIIVWLTLVLLGPLGLMGSSLAFRVEDPRLFSLALINPLHVYDMAGVHAINASLDVLGPAGMYAMRTYGDALPYILAVALAAWIIIPLSSAFVIFSRRSLV